MRRLLVVVTVYFLVFGYAQVVAGVLVFPGWRPGTPELLVLLVGPNAGWLLHQAWRNALTRWVLRAAWLWMGLAFLLLSVVLPVHLLLLLGLPGDLSAVLLVAAYAPLAIWSIVNAHRLEVRRIALSSPKLDRPVRLVQLSDVHVGSRGPGFLPRIVRRVNALDPDAVFVTGDLVDLMRLPEDALDPIGALAAPAFFAIGNHERYVGSDAVCARLEALGVTVLRNARVEWGTMRIVGIDDAEARDQVAQVLGRLGDDGGGGGGHGGIGSGNNGDGSSSDDPGGGDGHGGNGGRDGEGAAGSAAGSVRRSGDDGHGDRDGEGAAGGVAGSVRRSGDDGHGDRDGEGAAGGVAGSVRRSGDDGHGGHDGEEARFTILMYHRPDGLEDAARSGIDLMLCGHTHNGQIVPFHWLVKRYFPRIAGRYEAGATVLYVSPGTGTWGPTMRLGSSNEITVFELSPAPAGARSLRHGKTARTA